MIDCSDDINSRLERMSVESFGKMRDATEEELKGIDQYIKSISKPIELDENLIIGTNLNNNGER